MQHAASWGVLLGEMRGGTQGASPRCAVPLSPSLTLPLLWRGARRASPTKSTPLKASDNKSPHPKASPPPYLGLIEAPHIHVLALCESPVALQQAAGGRVALESRTEQQAVVAKGAGAVRLQQLAATAVPQRVPTLRGTQEKEALLPSPGKQGELLSSRREHEPSSLPHSGGPSRQRTQRSRLSMPSALSSRQRCS